MTKKRLLAKIYWILVIILIIIGFWLRYDNLGKINFQSDEFFHLYTAKGYLETGHFVQWDFLTNEPKGDYIRAFPYTWLVAQSFKIFGVSEYSARMPSLIFGVLFLPLIYWLALKITKNKTVALLTLVLIVFDNSFIWSSRLCRMYSMFIFFAALAAFLIFKGLEKKNNTFNYYYLAAGGILLAFTYLVHEAALLLGLGFLVYFLFNIKEKRYKILLMAAVACLLIFLMIDFFVTPLTTGDFFTVRANPNWVYFIYPFNQLRLSWLAWMIVLAGFIFYSRFDKLKLYIFSLGIPVIIFFVFFADRYAAKKYLLFVIPFLLILFIDSFYLLIKKIFKSPCMIYYFAVIFLLTGPVFSWPGITKNIFMQKALADQNYEKDELHNYQAAYQYLEQHYTAGEPILIQGKESYYFTRTDLNLISMKANKEYKFEEFMQIIQQNKSGWLVYPKYKSGHVSDKIIDYAKKNLQLINEVSDTNIKVFHWQN